MSAIKLRGYQDEAIEAVRERFRGGDRTALIVLATGGGKTLTALTAVAQCVGKGGRVLWVAHRAELLQQPRRVWEGLPQFAEVGRAGVVKGSTDETGADVVFASAQTIGVSPLDEDSRLRRILDHGRISLVVLDEAHHYPDDGRGMFGGLVTALRELCAPWFVGLTATPERTDGRPLGSLWGVPAYARGLHELIRDGYLVSPTMQVEPLELAETAKTAIEGARSDKEAAALANGMIRTAITDHAVATMAQHRGRPALVYGCGVDHVLELAEALAADGWKTAAITGKTKSRDRLAYQTAYQRGELDAIVNCGVLTEGTDLPRTEIVVLARPVRSKPLYIQIVGRGLRLSEGKTEAIVLDLFGLGHTLIHAAALLDVIDNRIPFVGTMTRSVGGVARGSRVEVEPTDGGGWVVVALVISDGYRLPVDPIEVEIGVHVHRDGPSDAPGAQVIDTGRRSVPRPHWLHVSPRVRVTAGQGQVYIVETEEPGLWNAYHVPKRARTPRKIGGPLPIDVAEALGADLFRQAAYNSKESRKYWGPCRPSESQLRLASRYGIEHAESMTRGQISDAISLHLARRLVARGAFQ